MPRGFTHIIYDDIQDSLRYHVAEWKWDIFRPLTVLEKIKLMWERSSYYKKQEAKKKQLELALYYKKHKPKPYYRAKERW